MLWFNDWPLKICENVPEKKAYSREVAANQVTG